MLYPLPLEQPLLAIWMFFEERGIGIDPRLGG